MDLIIDYYYCYGHRRLMMMDLDFSTIMSRIYQLIILFICSFIFSYLFDLAYRSTYSVKGIDFEVFNGNEFIVIAYTYFSLVLIFCVHYHHHKILMIFQIMKNNMDQFFLKSHWGLYLIFRLFGKFKFLLLIPQ